MDTIKTAMVDFERESPKSIDGFKSEKYTPKIMLIAIILVAMAIRLTLASVSEVWLDEANGILLAQKPIGEWFTFLKADSSPPFYYLLLKWTIALTSAAPLRARILSLLAALATFLLLFSTVKKAFRSDLSGLIAVALLAINPLHIYYSVEIRMYALLIFLALLFYRLLFFGVFGSARFLAALGCGTALTYTHHYAVPYAACAISLAFALHPAKRMKFLFLAGLLFIFYLPLYSLLSSQLGNSEHIAWILPFWQQYPGGFGLFRSIQSFIPGGNVYPYVPIRGLNEQFLLFLLYFLPFPFLFIKKGRRVELTRDLLLQGGLVLAPLLLIILFSYLIRPIYLAGRSDIVVLVHFILFTTIVIARIPRTAALVYLLSFTLISAICIVTNAERLAKPGNVLIARMVSFSSCTEVVVAGLACAPIRYYLSLQPQQIQIRCFPEAIAAHPGNFDPRIHSLTETAAEAKLLVSRIKSDDLCLVAASHSFYAPLIEDLSAKFLPGHCEDGLATSLNRLPQRICTMKRRTSFFR